MGADYDAWKTDYCATHVEADCHECYKKESRLDNIKDYFEGIIDMVYSKEKFSPGDFEGLLDEVCYQLDIKLPSGELMISRKKDRPAILENWLKFNDEHLETFNQKII